jgi:hypothetical protein
VNLNVAWSRLLGAEPPVDANRAFTSLTPVVSVTGGFHNSCSNTHRRCVAIGEVNMKHSIEVIVAAVYAIFVYCALPITLVIGWARWAKREQTNATLWSILSLIGFTFATLSAFLAVSSIAYARAIGGFPFYDPLLMKIYRWGGRLSLAGFVFGVVGCWRGNPLRWYAPACAVAVFIFWFGAAFGE